MASPDTRKIIVVNGQRREAHAANIAELLRELGRDPKEQGIAVAVNDAVVPRSEWAAAALQSGDVIEVVTAKQGG